MTRRRAFIRIYGHRLMLLRTLFAVICAASIATLNAAQKPEDFSRKIRPVLKQYCFPCHSSEKHKGDFDMERFTSLSEIKHQPKIWQRVSEQLANNEMPPGEKPQPKPEEKSQITN